MYSLKMLSGAGSAGKIEMYPDKNGHACRKCLCLKMPMGKKAPDIYSWCLEQIRNHLSLSEEIHITQAEGCGQGSWLSSHVHRGVAPSSSGHV